MRSAVVTRENPLSFFYLLVSWYRINSTPSKLVAIDFNIDSEEDNRLRPILEESPIITRQSGPQEPPNNHNTLRPGPKGKAKMAKYEDHQPDKNELAHSLASEYGEFDVPVMRTSKVKKAFARTNEKL